MGGGGRGGRDSKRPQSLSLNQPTDRPTDPTNQPDREARRELANRPWRVDDFDAFCDRVYGPRGDPSAPAADPDADPRPPPFRRVMIFVDNAGADIVLGMLPFLRELLRLKCEVVLVANSLPAINDITAPELRSLLSAAAEVCPIIKAARTAAKKVECGAGFGPGTAPPFPGMGRRQPSLGDLAALSLQQQQQQPLHHHHHHHHHLAGGSPAAPGSPGVRGGPGAFTFDKHLPNSDLTALGGLVWQQQQPTRGGSGSVGEARLSADSLGSGSGGTPTPTAAAAAAASQRLSGPPEARLFVVASGTGGPCLDLRRVPATLADATVGVDLLVIEGMGRAIHTNLYAAFKCDSLKLAMIKTERLAKKLFNGKLYDCVCLYQPGAAANGGGAAAAPVAAAAAGAAAPNGQAGFVSMGPPA